MMRLSRALVLGALAGLVCGLACTPQDDKKKKKKKQDTVDTSVDSGDTAEPEPFVPAWWTPVLYFGLRNGIFAEVVRDGATWFPIMAIRFGNEAYPETGDDADRCDLYFSILPSRGSAAPSTAHFDWVMDTTYLNSACENLDTAIFGDMPGAYFDSLKWEFAAITANEAFLRNTSAAGHRSLQDYIFAVNLYIDGRSWAWNGEAGCFGFAEEADPTGTVTVGSYIDAADIGTLPDGFYTLSGVGMWPVY